MPAATDSATGDLNPEFPDHPRDVHEDTTGSQYGKIRAKPDSDHGFSCMLAAEPVMHFPTCLARGRERELVGMDLDIDEEEVGIVGEHPGNHVGHAGAHLVFDHRVCAINEESDQLFVAFRVAGDIEDILDDLAAVIEPEPELFVIEGKGDILAGLFRVLVPDQGEEEGPFRSLAPVADTGQWPGGGG